MSWDFGTNTRVSWFFCWHPIIYRSQNWIAIVCSPPKDLENLLQASAPCYLQEVLRKSKVVGSFRCKKLILQNNFLTHFYFCNPMASEMWHIPNNFFLGVPNLENSSSRILSRSGTNNRGVNNAWWISIPDKCKSVFDE